MEIFFGYTGGMVFSVLFCDLDDTLYPPSSGLWEVIGDRISVYMRQRLHIPEEKILALRQQYYQAYGTTLRGLQNHFGVDPGEYLAYVHDVPLQDYLAPNPALREALLKYPQRRLIFTNADRDHAHRVLEILNLADCFEQIIDVLDIAPYCKPQPEAFEIALKLAGQVEPRQCILLDDKIENLAVARRMGFYTVWVGRSNGSHPDYHASVASLNDLPLVLSPDLEHWE